MKLLVDGRLTLPAEAPRAFRFATDALVTTHGRLGRLRAIAFGARVGGPVLDGGLPREVEAAFAFAGDRTDEWVLLRDYGNSGRGRAIIFLFDSVSMGPAAVVKLRPAAVAGPTLLHEAEALRAIGARVGPEERGLLPRVLDYAEGSAGESLMLSPLAGRPLALLMQRSLRPRAVHGSHLEQVAAWLGGLHRRTRVGERACVHGDLWMRNLLFSPDGQLTGVVDWERADLEGDPADDVFLLPLLFAVEAPAWLRGSRRAAEFETAFSGRGEAGRAIATYFRTYRAAARIDPQELEAGLQRFLARREPELAARFRAMRRSVLAPD